MDKMILIDLETQNFSVETGIYEVACLVVEGYEIVGKLYLGNEVDGYTGDRHYGYGFHNICRNPQCLQLFRRFMERYPYPLVAHNCSFDKKFLLYYGWVEDTHPFYCSIRAIREEVPFLSSYSLRNLVRHFEIADETDHKAMSDTMNLFKLLRRVRPQIWVPLEAQSHRKSRKRWEKPVKPRPLEEIDLPIETTDILSGENICFTGKSDVPRHTMQEIAIKNGARLSSNITKKTTMLVVGPDAGKKLQKARQNGVSIISNQEFMERVNLTVKDLTGGEVASGLAKLSP